MAFKSNMFDGSSSMRSYTLALVDTWLTGAYIGVDEQGSSQCQSHPPTTRETLGRLGLILLVETKTGQQGSSSCRTSLCLHVHQSLLNLAQSYRELILLLLQLDVGRTIFVGCGQFLELFELLVDVDLVGLELVCPDIGLKDRLEGGSLISGDFLLDVEDRDMGRDRNFSQSDVSKQGRFTHTVTTNETVSSPSTHRKSSTGPKRSVSSGEVNV